MTFVPALQFDVQEAGISAAAAIVDLAETVTPGEHSPTTLTIGVDRAGVLPAIGAAEFDLLLTVAGAAPRDWVSVAPTELDATLARLCTLTQAYGLPAAVLAQVLRTGRDLAVPDALLLESFAYSTLLGGQSFREWLARRGPRAAAPPGPRVRGLRDGEVLTITLAHPARRNALDACMRDELVEQLVLASDDPTRPSVQLRAEGPDFSAGGDLAEFGGAIDPVTAHAIRTLRAPARLIHALGARIRAYLHGACVGAGIEIPAAAGHVVAAPGTRFWLPELAMGLMPGAGGTVTIARRIGRRRMLYWALTGERIDARRAVEWGLVDEVRSDA